MTKLTAIHNVSPNAGAELARLEKEVAKMEGILAQLSPDRFGRTLETLLRPLRAEMALVANEQAQRDKANAYDNFGDVDLNALIEEVNQ